MLGIRVWKQGCRLLVQDGWRGGGGKAFRIQAGYEGSG